MSTRLVADVGGTNTRIALYDAQTDQYHALATFNNRDYDTFEAVVASWLDALSHTRPQRACIAIAAVPIGDRVSMANMDWSFSCGELAAQFGFTEFRCINDFEANAFALPHLKDADMTAIHPGNGHDCNKYAVLGPGTGLGGATVETLAHLPHTCAAEPGYMSLAPASELEIEIFRVLLGNYPQVYAELLVSGPGLLRLHNILVDITDTGNPASSPAQVSQLALQRSDATAVLALKLFCGLLGSIAGDFTLATGAYGGLHLAGGIVPTMVPFLLASEFHSRYCDKGAMSDFLKDIPVYAITTAQPGLIGAAHAPITLF